LLNTSPLFQLAPRFPARGAAVIPMSKPAIPPSRAPDPPRRSADEIFDEIKRLDGLTLDRENEKVVRQIITNLSGPHGDEPPTFGYRAENKEYLSELNTKIDELTALLGAAPNEEIFYHLFNEFDPPTLLIPSLIQARAEMRQEAGIRRQKLISALADVRSRSEQLIESKAGKHRSAGHLQERAAYAAHIVLLLTGSKISNDSSKSLYRRLGSLFFEVITGEERDVGERACDWALDQRLERGTEKPQN
jgi:hypothetical protein